MRALWNFQILRSWSKCHLGWTSKITKASSWMGGSPLYKGSGWMKFESSKYGVQWFWWKMDSRCVSVNQQFVREKDKKEHPD